MPASDRYSSHKDAIRHLANRKNFLQTVWQLREFRQIKAAATGAKSGRRFSIGILRLLGVSRNEKWSSASERRQPLWRAPASGGYWSQIRRIRFEVSGTP